MRAPEIAIEVNDCKQILLLNKVESILVDVRLSGAHQILRIERCKVSGAGFTRTGVKFELALHRAPALAQLIVDTAALHASPFCGDAA